MPKTTITYWNALKPENQGKWTAIEGTEGMLEELTLAMQGRLYDAAFDMWLETGHYASRPPGEVHGPFIAEEECVVLEMSYPSQSV